MSKYVKPVISLDEGMAEGVYAASGCLVGYIKDINYETGGTANKYRFEVHYTHATTDHSNTAQTVVVTLNYPVKILDGNAQGFSYSGDGTSTLTFVRTSSMNNSGNDNGSFNVVVTPVESNLSAQVLKATLVSVTDNGFTF